MKNKITFVNEIDYVFEAWQLLKLLADPDPDIIEKFKKAVTHRNESETEHICNCVAFCEKGMKLAKEHFKERMDEIRCYFAEIEREIIAADFILSWSDWAGADGETCLDVDAICDAYAKLSPEVLDALFLSKISHEMDEKEFDAIVGCAERGIQLTDAERIRNIFAYIQTQDFKDENKLRIQELYLNRDTYRNAVAILLKDCVNFLKQSATEMESLCVEWSNYWGDIVEEGRFLEQMESVLKWTEDKLDKPIFIKPSIVQCSGIFINYYGKVIPSRSNYHTTCMLGVMFDDKFNLNAEIREEYQWENMIPVFRALGDKSKADILLFIMDKPAYGSEIAKKLGITTATVSHHMNKLVQLRLIEADIQDGRVYYRARKEQICEMFRQCTKLFDSEN